MDFDQIYRSTEHYFGTEPNRLLREYRGQMATSQRVLDLGAGQGRNALFLAQQGFGVDAVDPSRAAIETIAAAAAGQKLDIRTYRCSFETYAPDVPFYSGILALGLIQLLSWESIQRLVDRIRSWTRSGSLVLVMTFTTEDPTLARFEDSPEWTAAGKNSLFHQAEGYRTFLEYGELLQLFAGFETLYHREDPGCEHHHGDGKVVTHAWAEGVFRRGA